MGKDELTKTEITPSFSDDQKKGILVRTPKNMIKSRQGRGGKNFDYVEVGYVVTRLNEVFNYLWDFEITEQQVGKTQVWVKGLLTVHLKPGFSIRKSAFGGAEMKMWDKMWSNTDKTYVDHPRKGMPIDMGDDLKAAAADALKKAASLIGIASDIYYPQLDRLEEEKPATEDYASVAQKAKIFALIKEMNLGEDYKEKIKDKLGLTSFADITKDQASSVIEELQGQFDKEKAGEAEEAF